MLRNLNDVDLLTLEGDKPPVPRSASLHFPTRFVMWGCGQN